LAVAFVLPLFAAALASPSASGAAASVERPNALAPPPLPPGFRSAGALATGHPLSLEIVLAPADPAKLDSLLGALYDPSSPRFHQWLAPGAFATQFAPAPGVRSAVVDWLGGLGLHPQLTSAFTVSAHGTTSQVSSGLSVSLGRYRAQGGSEVYASEKTPEVPAALAGKVAAILGLSDAPVEAPLGSSSSSRAANPHVAGTPVTACATATQLASNDNGYTANVAGSHYGINTLVADGANGASQKIGVYELAGSSAADIDTARYCASGPCTPDAPDAAERSNTHCTGEP